MEYPEEAENLETGMEGVPQYPVFTESPEGLRKEQSWVTRLLL